MQFFNIVILAFVAAVSAQSTNQTSLTNQTTHVHESIPDLKKACVCPPVNCPSALMSPKAVGLPMQKCGCNSMLQEKPGWMPSANHEFMQHMQFMLDLLAETNVLILPGFEKEKMG
ncbi:hypothetical protein EG327_008104 [Venturia inaequalis]|uniref:Uncharacterized protein n=1 Tax=Venturia inaequalis TaxID=5025 RepID=A0A8H3VUA2_VENIN|nr:hypothetical protein EG327_008104 [Venturia inaequalis]